eukprot:COSAG03_NODE_9414_length_721_cov_1.252412_1_plen_132_part_10
MPFTPIVCLARAHSMPGCVVVTPYIEIQSYFVEHDSNDKREATSETSVLRGRLPARCVQMRVPATMVAGALLTALLAASTRRVQAYLQPTGDSLTTAHVGVWPRTHGDVTNHAIKLLAADGHGGVAAAFGEE